MFDNVNNEAVVVLFCCKDIVDLSKNTAKITISIEFICLQLLRRPPILPHSISLCFKKSPLCFLEQTIKYDIEEPGEQM